MDGRAKRTQRILDRIKETSLQLFSTQGVENTTMEEVAAAARVSKVTIYNHFHSKDELLHEVLSLYSEKVFQMTEEILHSDLEFLEKLRLMLLSQTKRPQMASNNHLLAFLEKDSQAGGKIRERLRQVIILFFEQGKKEGYIDEDLPFDLFYLYSEIYRAGYEAKLADVEAVITNQAMAEKMDQLFFWGILKRGSGSSGT